METSDRSIGQTYSIKLLTGLREVEDRDLVGDIVLLEKKKYEKILRITAIRSLTSFQLG
ncbi:hypothetical protein [Candidatus Tisiphia endosymbiont of Nemotelus uliginosus]|uniref:hypothetical protein n=1 Tax=Candidatus Tisiphia endosymbiont of Nemotelus uliginosus TaxID=3077926 RepID=UPI0035C87F5E